MKTLLKLGLYLIGFVMVLVVAAGLWLANLDPNEHKEWITNKVQEETGRTLTLDGDLALSLYPWLGLEANNLTLSNAAGFGSEPFFYADHLKFRIKLLPLLQEKYEIDTASIHGAVINLARNEKGTNWDDLVSGEEQKPSSGFPLAAIVLGGLDVQDAKLSWHDQTTDTRYDVSSINMSTGELAYGEPIALSLALNANANKPALSGSVQLKNTILYDIENGRYTIEPLGLSGTIRGENIPGGSTELSLTSVVEVKLEEDTATISGLQFNVLGAQIAGDINVSKLQSPTPSIQSALDIKGDDLSRLFKIVEIEPLASQLAGLADRSFTLNTELDADMERGDVDVSQLSASLLGSNFKGHIKARNIQSDTPGYQGELQASGPDLPALMQVIGEFAGDDSALSQYGRQLAAVEKKVFNVDVGFDVDMKSGDIDLPVLSIKTLGIDIVGKLEAKDLESKSGMVNGKLSIKGSRLANVLRVLEQQDLAEVLQSVDFVTGVSGSSGNLRLQPMSLDAIFSGKQIPNSPVILSLNADTNINLTDEKLSLNKLTLQGLGLNLTGKLNVDKFQSSQDFSGQLNVAQFNLRKLMRGLNRDVPVTADKSVLQKVALDTQFSGSKSKLDISQLALVLDDTKLNGTFSLNDFSKPAYRFGIDIDQINIDRYLPPQPKGKNKKPITPETAAGAAAQLPVELLRSLDVRGNLNIGKLTVSNAKLNKVTLRIDGENGEIKLDPIAANLYQGRYSGNININAIKKLPRLTINSKLFGIQVEPLLHDVTGEAKVGGIGDLSAALIAIGANTDTMKKTLNGQMSFNFKDGAIKGFNLGKIMRIGKSLKDTFTLSVSDREETDFTNITGNPIAKNGVIRLDDLKASSPGLRLSGQGVLADLPHNTLNYKISASLVATSTGQGGKQLQEEKLKGIPLDCTFKGALDKPKRSCDASRILNVLKDKLLKSPNDLLDNILPGLDGNKVPGTQQSTEPTEEQGDPLREGLDIFRGILER